MDTDRSPLTGVNPHSRETFGERFDRRFDPGDSPPLPGARERPVSLGATGSGESFMLGALYFLASLVGGLGALGGLHHLATAAQRGVDVRDWLIFAGWLTGGLGLAGALAAGAMLLGMLARQRQHLRLVGQELADLGGRVEQLARLVSDPRTLDRLDERLARLDESLAEVAHNCLLDEQGRARKRGQVVQQERDQAVEIIHRELADGQWDRARVSIERFRANFPSEAEQASRLADDLDRRRNQAEAEDVASARQQCEEWMSVSAWDRALGLAQELVGKHPESTAAKGLLARVDRERKISQDQQRHALYTQIQRHTSRRQWKEAMEAAQRLVGQFPDSIEAEAVRAQMETLSANAEIQHRQQVEEAIKDLVRRQRYEEAVDLAEELTTNYPNSPQAAALRDQLPRLRELAEQAAREARKRRVQW